VQPEKAVPPAVVVPDDEAIRNPPDSTPLARYYFDEGKGTVAGSEANGSRASIHGAKHVKAGNGYALKFDGNDDYVTVAQSRASNRHLDRSACLTTPD
jgi:hypothetical protein